MSIGKLMKKATSIFLIVAMVMTSAGINTLANSLDAVAVTTAEEKVEASADKAEASADKVEANADNVGESTASPEEIDELEADEVSESSHIEEEPEEDESVAANSEEEVVEASTDEKESVEASTDESETVEASTEEKESVEESPEESESVAASTEEEVVEASTESPEEDADKATASDADVVLSEQLEDIISTASEALFGTDSITLTYNFNDKTNGGKGSTDVKIEEGSEVASTKLVENGKAFGKFEESIYRDGYVLLGWSFERDGEVIKETDIVDFTEDKTIYAIWEPNKYKFRIAENVYINDAMSDGSKYIEFTFDENIVKTINDNGIKAPTKDDNPEIYDCLELLGWGFSGDTENVVKDEDNFTDVTLVNGNAHDPYIFAIYDIKYIHVKLNASEGYYGEEGNKILDLGYVTPYTPIHKLPGYEEPTPLKDMRFEKWWVPLIPEAPYDPYLKDINIAAGGRIGSNKINEDVAAFRWNEEYKAHYEEDRYRIKLYSGGMFHVTVGDGYGPAEDWGVFTDDPSKYKFTDRLGNEHGGGSREARTIYILKGKNLKEVLDEYGFEAPVAYDRDLLGWQQGSHPDRENGKYVNFNPVDFSKITVEGDMEFTAVWKKKPLLLTFKKGPNMTFKSGREEFTLALPARDVFASPNGAVADCYEGNLYELKNVEAGEQGYEDPIAINEDGEVDDYNYEFRRWEDDEEFLDDKIIFNTTYVNLNPGGEDICWQEDKQKYKGLETISLLDRKFFDLEFDGRGQKIFENGETFYVDENGKKYADHIYGGDPYRAEPYVFTPVVDRIPMSVQMFSPFPVFPLNTRRQDLKIGSGIKIGEVDEYINTDFSKVEEEGYHFAGWYQIAHDKTNATVLRLPGAGVAIDQIEDSFNKGVPTIMGMSQPGLDTWFKYVQCTATDNLRLAVGQYLKKIDGDLVINRETAERYHGKDSSKIYVEGRESLDIIPIFTANLTLDAGDGKFADGNSEKTINGILIDTTTAIRDYVGAGYEVPTSNDSNKIFAGWRLETVDGRFFGEYEPIAKDTRLIATYIDKTNNVTLTIKLHGAETVEETVDEEGDTVYNVVEMEDVVMILPQDTKMGDIEKDLPVVKRKGYEYSPRRTLTPAWYYEYNDETGEYSKEIGVEDKILEDTTIHLKWTKEKYSYDFIYEIDGEEKTCASILGEFGQALKDCDFYQLAQIKNMFDFSLENQPEKGYKITGINKYSISGDEVTPDTLIDGNVRCRLTVKPMDTTITFDANGGELVGENTLTVPYGTTFKDILDVPQVSKEGFYFVGWIDDKEEQVNDTYRIGMTYEADKVKQTKLTAKWTETKIKVTFDAGEGKFSDGSNKLTFENVPENQLLANIKEGEKVYEEPTLANKTFDKWEVQLKRQFSNYHYTKDNKFGDGINNLEEEAKEVIVLKALYVDKTVTFSIKLSDPNQFTSALTFARVPSMEEKILPHDYVFSISEMFDHFYSGCTWVQTVKEGMTFGEWFDYIYDKGYRYRTEQGYILCGWKYEEPASIEAPRKKTFNMKDVDMNAAIKNGDVFTPLMSKGSFTVKVDANGGRYDPVILDSETASGVKIHQESITLLTYENVPAGTRSDKIDGLIMPKRDGYTLVGYSRYKNSSEKSLSSNIFVAGNEVIYAVWSKNENQHVQPTTNRDRNYRPSDGGGSSGGSGGAGGTAPGVLQNANAPRVGVVEGVGPQSSLPADAPKQYVQNVSAAENQQAQAQVAQLIANAGISGDAANSSQVQQAAAEVRAGLNIVDQYAKLANQISADPSITTSMAAISTTKIEAKEAYWHTDASGNVTLETPNTWGYVKNVWQPVTNDAGQTGWYKFDANGYMQTGLVQDGNFTYYLSEERGAGYGQMVCNQTINIGGLSMTFNASGALVNMQYSEAAAVQTLKDALTTPQAGAVVGPQPLSYLSNS